MPSSRRWTAAWAAIAIGIGVVFAVRVPLGLPYDEPAHWGTVLFYATTGRMPELGEPGATYEAQMGPVYYVLAAAVVRLTPSADPATQAHVLRLVGVVLMPVLVLLTARIGGQLSPRPAVATVAAALAATLPLLGATGGSIQNDYLTFVFVAVALLFGIRLLRNREANWSAHLAFGALIGLAVLTKVNALALVPAALLGYLVSPAELRRRLTWVAVAGGGLVATCGWWFVRNVLVYGDLTGARGMARMGVVFPPLRWSGPGDVASWFGNLVSYVYIPVEYYRNLLQSPLVLRIGAIGLAAVTLVVCAGYVVSRRSELRRLGADPGLVFALGVFVFGVLMWVAFSLAIFNTAPRLVFQAAPVAAVLVAVAASRRWVALIVATVVAFLAADLWLASSATQIAGFPFLIG
jgi:D-alanyl-D-alanine carboxypeptidase (penicillin-binding protein 5/6)